MARRVPSNHQPHTFPLFRKEVEHRRIRPVVDENQRTLRGLDQLQRQRPRIPQLPVVEHALYRRLLRLHKEINLLFKSRDALIMPRQPPVNSVFKLGQSSIDRVPLEKISL